MMKFYVALLAILFLVVFLLQTRPSLAANNSVDIDYAKELSGKMPSQEDASDILNEPVDTKNLESHNDSSLLNDGSNELSSEMGKLVTDSEESRDVAKSEHKINSSNKSLNDSIKISHDPQAQTGEEMASSSEITSDTVVEKTCIEGVDFDTSVGYELVYDCKEEIYFGPLQTRPVTLDISGLYLYRNAPRNLGYAVDWKRKRKGWHIKTHLVNEWREYISRKENIPLQNIGGIRFPFGARGGGGATTPVYEHHRIVFDYYRFIYDYQWREKFKRLKGVGEYWQVSTPARENIVSSSQCYETSRRCLKSGVRTFFGKYEVSRPCWQEDIKYHCQSEPAGGCQHLENQGCSLKDSECLESSGGFCLKYKRTYACRGGEKRVMQYGSLGGVDFPSPVIEPNNNFSNVAYLAALNEANKDCVKQGNGMCRNPITIFPGKQMDCKKIISGCINCCSSMKGWGKNVGLSKCSGEEQGLALKRERGLCHRIDTYCSEKYFGKCTIKKTSFCCFNSKLARVFHEQGRSQLGISWGSAQQPNCGPLTLDQLAKIDFSKFDMEELFDALLNKGKKNSGKEIVAPKKGQVPDQQAEQYNSNRDNRHGGL